jgi:Zn-dependent peptidase ImmA (M78 family)/transcriptional regulator with XRE-family HTH domain
LFQSNGIVVKINPQMVTLAREYRGLTQEQLAKKINVGQARMSKIEGGSQSDLPEPIFESLCEALAFPATFFRLEEDLVGFGSSAYYYRKRADLTAPDRKRIHGVINLLRLHLKRLLTFVDIAGKRQLPSLGLDDYGGDPVNVARAVRAFWSLPDGPIKNLTSLVESAGVIVIPCEFETRAMDATSLRLAEMPPVIFMNKHVPGDRWRFTLAHELAHLVMHDVPNVEMEDEADAFAAEFLTPQAELRPQFSRLGEIRLHDLANLKPYWRVSIASLLRRATELGFVHETKRRYMWTCMAKWGWRLQEPNPIPREEPKTHSKMLEHFINTLEYSADDLAELLSVSPRDLLELHGDAFSPDQKRAEMRSRLRVVS